MATPDQVMDMYDYANNPFIDWSPTTVRNEPTQWHVEEEAHVKVHNKCRDKINFYARCMEALEDAGETGTDQWMHCCEKLTIWNYRLLQAQYN